jgi:hypothetical protein
VADKVAFDPALHRSPQGRSGGAARRHRLCAERPDQQLKWGVAGGRHGRRLEFRQGLLQGVQIGPQEADCWSGSVEDRARADPGAPAHLVQRRAGNQQAAFRQLLPHHEPGGRCALPGHSVTGAQIGLRGALLDRLPPGEGS